MLQCLPLPLHLLALYAADTLPVSLLHAETGFQGRVSARQTADGRQVGTNGDLQVNTRPATGARANGGDPLLTWQSLPLQGLTVALAPPARPRFKVRAMALTDFYSRLTITVEGRINLQDVAAQALQAPPRAGIWCSGRPSCATAASTPPTASGDRITACARPT